MRGINAVEVVPYHRHEDSLLISYNGELTEIVGGGLHRVGVENLGPIRGDALRTKRAFDMELASQDLNGERDSVRQHSGTPERSQNHSSARR